MAATRYRGITASCLLFQKVFVFFTGGVTNEQWFRKVIKQSGIRNKLAWTCSIFTTEAITIKMDEENGLLGDLMEACMELEDTLAEGSTEPSDAINEHIKKWDARSGRVPDFPLGCEWINTTEPLDMFKHLNGKVVILDFFTYCCINCMHILPDLAELERRHSIEKGLVVVGVHSAKFENELQGENVEAAVTRYSIKHPVINDHKATLWKQLQILCWPTLLILGPDGQPLFVLMGEGQKHRLFPYMENALSFYREKTRLLSHSLPLASRARSKHRGAEELNFPGGVACNEEGSLVIADSGHNRILVVDSSGLVKHCIGGIESGFKDGTFLECRFWSPQGVAWCSPDTIYVADTNNNAIRKVDLLERVVSTIPSKGEDGEVSSPWGLCFDERARILYIAMAGCHQIWALFLKDTIGFKNREHPAGSICSIAGSGHEENRNNAYPHRASFAQPSGLALDQEEHALYIADSESSSVRRLDLISGAVRGLVGGTADPKDLFAFGDKDAERGKDVRLQHPLDVCFIDGYIYVADSYNHKLKLVDVHTTSCTTVIGTGHASHEQLSEPASICVSADRSTIYIADTNNHAVKSMDLNSKQLHTVGIRFSNKRSKVEIRSDYEVTCEEIVVSPEGDIGIKMDQVNFASGFKLNTNAPNKWQIRFDEPDVWKIEEMSDSFGEKIVWVNAPRSCACTNLSLFLTLFVCSSAGLCLRRIAKFSVPVHVKTDAQSEALVDLVLQIS